MSNDTTSTGHPRQVHHPLRQWVIGLGWLGFALWSFELTSSALRLEMTDPVALRFAFHLLQISLGWLWPFALALHFRAWVQWDMLRYILMGAMLFLTIPVFLFSLLFLGVYWTGYDVNWQDEQTIYESVTEADVRVVAQTRYDGFATSGIQHRVVKLTPLLGLWQLAEPVDTAAFNRQGWRLK